MQGRDAQLTTARLDAMYQAGQLRVVRLFAQPQRVWWHRVLWNGHAVHEERKRARGQELRVGLLHGGTSLAYNESTSNEYSAWQEEERVQLEVRASGHGQ